MYILVDYRESTSCNNQLNMYDTILSYIGLNAIFQLLASRGHRREFLTSWFLHRGGSREGVIPSLDDQMLWFFH